MPPCIEVLAQTDKPLLVIVFTLATNSAECTENVTVRTVLHLRKCGIEPVANGAVVEVAAL